MPHPKRSTLSKHWTLDPNTVFLNHGSFGACPRLIFDSLVKWQELLEREPVKHLAYDIFPLLEKSRKTLSDFIGCKKDELYKAV